MFGQDAFHVTVAYDGDGRPLDPAKLNRISSVMVVEAAELDVENALIEFYVDSREYGGQVASADEPHKIHRADGPVRTEFCTGTDTPVKFSHYPRSLTISLLTPTLKARNTTYKRTYSPQPAACGNGAQIV